MAMLNKQMVYNISPPETFKALGMIPLTLYFSRHRSEGIIKFTQMSSSAMTKNTEVKPGNMR